MAGIGVVVLSSRRWRFAPFLAAVIVTAELLVLAPNGSVYAYREDPFPQTETTDRLLGLVAESPGSRVFGFDAKLFPNTAAAYGLNDIRVLDGLYVDRYMEYVRTFLQPTAYDRFVGGPYASLEDPFTRYADNPMFDLLGVRYLVSDWPLSGASDLMREIAQLVPSNAVLGLTGLTIGGEERGVLFMHPDQEFGLPPPPPGTTELSFSYGLSDAAFADPAADGVSFALIAITSGGRTELLWDDEVIPRVDPAEPEWRSAVIDLSGISNDLVELRLRTSSREN